MINISFNFIVLIAFIYLILGIFYPLLTIVLLAKRSAELTPEAKILYVIQIIVTFISLLFSGAILLFQGWRLDPVLAFSHFLLMILIVFLAIKDMLLGLR